MSIAMTGIDHTRAGVDIRSVFSFTKKRQAEAYAEFKTVPGISGCIILSTCNRMEFWLSLTDDADISPTELLCRYLNAELEAYAPFFVERREREASEHLFRLTAGMESQIMGEDQIITQVGDALAMSRSCYATDHTLEVLFRQAVTGAKRVKTEAPFSATDQSIIHAALQSLEDNGFSVAGRRCMVIGNGMMGRVSAQALLDRGADVTVTVRQYRSGVVDIPPGCSRIAYSERLGLLPACDLLISATSSPNYTLRLDELSGLRVDHPIILIDLAVPRDIDPQAKTLEWVVLYDVDSFKIDLYTERLHTQLKKAESILKEEEERFYAWYKGIDLVPRIQKLKVGAGADVSARLTPALRQTRLEDRERAALRAEVESASARMMNRLLFGLRAKLPEQEFRACLDAMEQIMQEKTK